MEQFFIEQSIEPYVIEQLIEQYVIEQLIEQYYIVCNTIVISYLSELNLSN